MKIGRIMLSPRRSALEQKLRTRLCALFPSDMKTDRPTTSISAQLSLVEYKGGLKAIVTLDLPDGPQPSYDTQKIKDALTLPGVDHIQIIPSHHRPAPQRAAETKPTTTSRSHANPLGLSSPSGNTRKHATATHLPDVKHVILVTSGKGGVGKSTIAAHLALHLAKLGYRTGLMDADIYGPSLPVLFDISCKAPFENGKIQPIETNGIKAMSIGFLLEEGQALAWRGPMVMGAIKQLLNDVHWGDLEYLIIDTPPGTGDAHLSLLQKLPISGTLIISTPHLLSQADMRRGTSLFQKMNTPIIGLIENMAWLQTPDGTRVEPFGKPQGAKAAQMLNIPYLGALPITPNLAASPQAHPSTSTSPETAFFVTLVNHVKKHTALYDRLANL